MKLVRARVQNYRSIKDTGFFEIEKLKTILVGPNEAGKTAILQALQQLNAPKGVDGFEALRDYPRSKYNDISRGVVDPKNVTVVEGVFVIEKEDDSGSPFALAGSTMTVERRIDNRSYWFFQSAPSRPLIVDIEKDLRRLAAHADQGEAAAANAAAASPKPAKSSTEAKLEAILANRQPTEIVMGELAKLLEAWLKEVFPLVDEDNEKEQARYDSLKEKIGVQALLINLIAHFQKRLPKFVLYSNYFRVRPRIHLRHLADRLESGVLDDNAYDYGNKCLLELLGFSARSLSQLGAASEPSGNDSAALKDYRDQLDKRGYQLNAASVRLTNEIKEIWAPDHRKAEAEKVRIMADSQYLKVVVEDSLGVEIELDQRSEGFQWMVSFFVVFFAESQGENANAILLLDEPGLNLHALKQREFRKTLSRLAERNQTLFTTHSPFLVGPDELDFVRVVEMVEREVGTKVNSNLVTSDSGALLPLQEALGYDLAQSLFTHERNLICEGLTDYWYIEGIASLLKDASIVEMNSKISVVPASSAGKVVYFATILHSQNLKVAALLDSDTAGNLAAEQDVLVHTLGNKKILRTKDYSDGNVSSPEIEDVIRETLIGVAKSDLNWDVSKKAAAQPKRPIIDVFEAEIKDFSKYRLAKAFIRWTRSHEAKDLNPSEVQSCKKLIEAVNSALK